MCYFITLVVRGSHEASIAPVLMRHGRRAEPIYNPSVQSILKPGEAQFLTTAGHCDCGTALGARTPDRLANQAAKLVKKGWSPSKIERCLADGKKADGRRQRPDSIDLWANIVRDLFALSDVQQVGLLLRAYSRSVENEVFNAKRATVRFDDFATRLSRIREGELLMIDRP